MPIKPQIRPVTTQLARLGARPTAPSPSAKLNSRAFSISRIQNTSTSTTMASTMTARYPQPKPNPQPVGRPVLAACQQFTLRGPVSTPSHSPTPTHAPAPTYFASSRTAAYPRQQAPCHPTMRMMGPNNGSPFSSTSPQRVQASTPHPYPPSRQTNLVPSQRGPSQRRLSVDLKASAPSHRAPQRLCSSLPNLHDPSATGRPIVTNRAMVTNRATASSSSRLTSSPANSQATNRMTSPYSPSPLANPYSPSPSVTSRVTSSATPSSSSRLTSSYPSSKPAPVRHRASSSLSLQPSSRLSIPNPAPPASPPTALRTLPKMGYTAPLPAPGPIPAQTIPRASYRAASPAPAPRPASAATTSHMPSTNNHSASTSSRAPSKPTGPRARAITPPKPDYQTNAIQLPTPDYQTTSAQGGYQPSTKHSSSRFSRLPQQQPQPHPPKKTPSPVFSASPTPRLATPAKPILKKVHSEPTYKTVRFSVPFSEKETEPEPEAQPTPKLNQPISMRAKLP